MEKKQRFEIGGEHAGLTVERYLGKSAGFSKAQIRGMKFRENGICVNGKRCRVTEKLCAGDVLEVCLETGAGKSEHLVSGICLPQILYEDADVIALDKPAGIAVHPAHGHYGDTLSNQLALYFRETGQQVQIHSIGRLDLETSGIVLFAKHRVAAARLSLEREKGQLQKQYLALCEGRFENQEGIINRPVAPIPGTLMKMCVHPQGKDAVTHFRVEHQYTDAALVRLWLETGRTHQIRVHMADAGHPLLGDRIYGVKKADPVIEKEPARAALHAEQLCFLQPFTGERIVLRSELPEDMRKKTTGKQR